MMESVRQFISANRVLTATAVLLLTLVFVAPARAVAMVMLRVFARILLVLALLALVSDGTRTLATDGGLVVTSFLEHWTEFAPASLDAVKRTLSLKVHPALWDGVLARLFALPAWLVLAGAAIILGYAARKRRRLNVYANA
jgi:heme A synthase